MLDCPRCGSNKTTTVQYVDDYEVVCHECKKKTKIGDW